MSRDRVLSVAGAHQSKWRIPELVNAEPWHIQHIGDYPPLDLPYLGSANTSPLILTQKWTLLDLLATLLDLLYLV